MCASHEKWVSLIGQICNWTNLIYCTFRGLKSLLLGSLFYGVTFIRYWCLRSCSYQVVQHLCLFNKEKGLHYTYYISPFLSEKPLPTTCLRCPAQKRLLLGWKKRLFRCFRREINVPTVIQRSEPPSNEMSHLLPKLWYIPWKPKLLHVDVGEPK